MIRDGAAGTARPIAATGALTRVGGGAMEQTTLSNGFFFPEGPSQGPDGRIYAVEMGGQVVARFGPDGVREEFAKTDGAPGASAWGPDGAVYVPNSGGLAFADGRPAGPGEPNS